MTAGIIFSRRYKIDMLKIWKAINGKNKQEKDYFFCDLTPCDFFFLGFVKFKIYVNTPQTVSELDTKI